MDDMEDLTVLDDSGPEDRTAELLTPTDESRSHRRVDAGSPRCYPCLAIRPHLPSAPSPPARRSPHQRQQR